MGWGTSRRGAVVASALALACVTALSGCTVGSVTTKQTATTSPTPQPTATYRMTATQAAVAREQKVVDALKAADTAAHDVPKAGLVVMSADLALPDGSISLHADAVSTGDDTYELRLSDFHSTASGTHTVWIRQFDEQPGDCIEEGVTFAYSPFGADFGTTSPQTPMDLSSAGEDPSFLRSLVLTDDDTGGDCSWTVAAAVPLVWHAPDRHPGLAVRDAGADVGARGTVVKSASGEFLRYTVAKGDTPLGIEARFGLSPRALQYLNARQGLALLDQLEAGQTLNLSVTGR